LTAPTAQFQNTSKTTRANGGLFSIFYGIYRHSNNMEGAFAHDCNIRDYLLKSKQSGFFFGKTNPMRLIAPRASRAARVPYASRAPLVPCVPMAAGAQNK